MDPWTTSYHAPGTIISNVFTFRHPVFPGKIGTPLFPSSSPSSPLYPSLPESTTPNQRQIKEPRSVENETSSPDQFSDQSVAYFSSFKRTDKQTNKQTNRQTLFIDINFE
jgi:hypothetical protein